MCCCSVGGSIRSVGYEGHSTFGQEERLHPSCRHFGRDLHPPHPNAAGKVSTQPRGHCPVYHHFRHGWILYETHHLQTGYNGIFTTQFSQILMKFKKIMKIIKIYLLNVELN